MKASAVAVGLSLVMAAGAASAQEHWTEGPVWACSAYRTKQGQFDDYLKYLRQNYAVTTAEAKKQGLILDSKLFVQVPARPDDWDVLICSLYPSFAKALDFNASDDEKNKAISAKHYKTSDQDKQREVAAKRFAMRDFLGTTYPREVSLKPLP